MLSASYVTLRNGMCFQSQMIIVSGSGTLADHVAYIKQEYAAMNPIVGDYETMEITSAISLMTIGDRMGVDVQSIHVVFLNKD